MARKAALVVVDADADADPDADTEQKYRAPALEKGLDILELLARESRPLNAVAISDRLKRSPSELFRMIQVLEHRGFIRQAPGGGFVPTEKLFALGMEQPPIKTLLETALPQMRELTRRIGQSCHLTMRSGGEIVVVARIESSEQIGFTVRIGHRRPMLDSNSAVVHFAFLDEPDRARWIAQIPDLDPVRLDDFRERALRARERGFERAKSSFVVGITDLAAPILRGVAAAAVLTVPYVQSIGEQMRVDDVLKHLRATAAEISAGLLVSDHRV
ncbi:IclR family transcriptional regulator [Sphingomonas sp. Leaf412]|uniref:IclR family transcriptional regulator n=1 Tax=Sphingomonas sp. Leaf412 TaxID=1736370 RepID=UPI00190FC266|nr:IclR family transcriptional regulator [Sphingomonas sp. Leaf412]